MRTNDNNARTGNTFSGSQTTAVQIGLASQARAKQVAERANELSKAVRFGGPLSQVPLPKSVLKNGRRESFESSSGTATPERTTPRSYPNLLTQVKVSIAAPINQWPDQMRQQELAGMISTKLGVPAQNIQIMCVQSSGLPETPAANLSPDRIHSHSGANNGHPRSDSPARSFQMSGPIGPQRPSQLSAMARADLQEEDESMPASGVSMSRFYVL
mmetsp:Transcript_44759/g.70077  ORF Transcript_44759/g.70077 Transcript_44759/m.70077 type:complete len:215 (-) Transcript_44759:672-1316(-)